MRIYLYLANKVLSFSIPTSISGSFSFDENENEELKLINIEAREGRWVLYSTSESSVLNGGAAVSALELLPNRYYNLKRKNKVYLIYVTKAFDNSYSLYSYNDDINFVVGNKNPNCNIVFSNPLINDEAYTITKMESGLTLKIGNIPVYVNDNIVKSQSILLRHGDKIDLYGFKVLVLNNLLAINNPSGLLNVNGDLAKINQYSIEKDSDPVDTIIKDVDLYSKDDYFSKSPRIRRLIETKEIELSQPPKLNEGGEMPLILTLGPTIAMGILSLLRLIQMISDITSGAKTFAQSYLQLIQVIVMLLSALLWPILTRIFTKRMKKKNKKILNEKYTKYLNEKRKELSEEEKLQRDILNENLLPVDRCLKIIEQGNINFWDKRIEQNDFLEVFVGTGSVKLDVNINYPKEGFTIDEDDLKKQTDAMVAEYKYINNVPVGYSLYKNKITALMGEPDHTYGFINNIILQLITYYTYEDLKIVVFTNDVNKEKWEYIKYLNHSFSNDKTVRFFSTNQENAKTIIDFLNYELQNRIAQAKDETQMFKPHYLIITDDFHQIRRLGFTKQLTELDANFGFSMIIMENRIGKLPSKCNNFISLTNGGSSILMNSFEKQEKIDFHDQINNTVDMMAVVKKLSNIPIEFEDGNNGLPESITFLEMEKVGKVEQLNILNRWQQNDSTQSLRAEVGVDEEGNLLYLDLHEKYHGPHGLIAGMTGSGKSEFIITYILSMAINYSPDDVAFILIDYKGGGLAGAFENKVTGITLPHLAGTITNLDKAEMDRTLVSIDSEIKRRQALFNEARDQLGESTIDIYKYQRFYKEGRLKEPCPHLFIICDEFAELKSQQPDFMDNLISVARIGRSLGVHLILATQKPSGVVNDQIWSNTKFRVCLKVQDASDSREMLKRPEAASIKQTGRFYLQVGYDEYFALGQSGWCGAKYYPSEKIIKQVDKSINFIGDTGNFIKSIQAGNNMKIEAQGEQISAIMNSIIEVSKMTNKKATRLWLNNIDPVIITDDLEKKYNFEANTNDVTAIIGEYDAPEKQEQGLLTYSLMKDGNTLIFGNDEAEKEKLVNSLVYSLFRNYTAKNINIYAIDYGSESLRMFNGFPQMGGVVYLGEDDKFNSLLKLIKFKMKERKKQLLNYGGSFENYNNNNEVKLPQILFIINNYEGILDVNGSLADEIVPIARDSVRYGISILITCSGVNSIGRRLSQSFENRYGLHLNDPSDYFSIFNKRCSAPRDTFGRGLVDNGGIHEFQTASICNEGEDINTKLTNICNKVLSFDNTRAGKIPELPEVVTYDIVKKITPTVDCVPIGVDRSSLDIVEYSFNDFSLYPVISNKIANTGPFTLSLLDIITRIENSNVYFIDALNLLPQANKVIDGKKVNYFADKLDFVLKGITDQISQKDGRKHFCIFYGLGKLKEKVDVSILEALFTTTKSNENAKIIVCDGSKALKELEYETWFSKLKNNTDGIWIGSGASDQQNIRISKYSKEMGNKISNEYGYYIVDSDARMIKFINFYAMGDGKNEK